MVDWMSPSPCLSGVVPTLGLTKEARDRSYRYWKHWELVDLRHVERADLQAAYDAIREVAESVSGASTDAIQRAIVYYSIYEDSQGNFMFPLVATHGSLWGVSHTLRIERVLGRLRRWSHRGTVDRWLTALDAVRDINRRVFVEVYTTFYFTRYYGRHPDAARLILPDVLMLYNQVHEAVTLNRPLSPEERRGIYRDIFIHEQDQIVDPGIQQAATLCGNRWFVRLFSFVYPRFKYFPPGAHLTFTDFRSVDQRNREGLRALDFAEQVGAERVLEAMGEYQL